MKTLLGVYGDLRESASTSDFPALMGTELHRELINFFKNFPTNWRSWAKIGETVDFKTKNAIFLSEADDLEKILQGGGYADSSIDESKLQIFVETFGRAFSVTRQMVVNDDMDTIKSFPQKLGRAAARKIATMAITALESNPNAYDGTAFFHADHNNLLTTALTANITGADAVFSAVQKIENQTDSKGVKLGLTAKTLVVPNALKAVANILCNHEQVPNAAGTLMVPNPVFGMLTPVVEPALTDATDWYVFADPVDAPVVIVSFLKGKQDPDLLLEAPTAVAVMGGAEDPFGFEYDEIKYKVRHDFGVSMGLYHGGVKSVVAN